MKQYYTKYNVGKVKYLVNYHDGVKRHDDLSRFFYIATFSNKKKMNDFIKELKEEGYRHRDEVFDFSKIKKIVSESRIDRWVITLNEPKVISGLSIYGPWKENEDGTRTRSKVPKKKFNVYLKIIDGSLVYAKSRTARWWKYVELGLPFSNIIKMTPYSAKKMTKEEQLKAECQKFLNRCHPKMWKHIQEECRNYLKTGKETDLPDFLQWRSKISFVSMRSKIPRYQNETIASIKRAMDEGIRFSDSYSAKGHQGRDRSIEVSDEGRAWFSSEYPGCGNGDYYLLISPTTAIYYERD